MRYEPGAAVEVWLSRAVYSPTWRLGTVVESYDDPPARAVGVVLADPVVDLEVGSRRRKFVVGGSDVRLARWA